MELFREIYNSLLNTKCSDRADTYFILADFKFLCGSSEARGGSLPRRGALGEDAQCSTWHAAGKFTSDRTIQEYVDEIWHLDHEVIKVDPETFEA